MTPPRFIYPPVWPEIVPWAIRLTANYDVPLQPPPASKEVWTTKEVRMVEIQRFLSIDFTFVPTYEVSLDRSLISLLERVVEAEWFCLSSANSLERYQSYLRMIANQAIRKYMEDEQHEWVQHGLVLPQVRPLAALCYMEVFRRLPEHRRQAASAQSNDPIKLLVLEAIAEDQAGRGDQEAAWNIYSDGRGPDHQAG